MFKLIFLLMFSSKCSARLSVTSSTPSGTIMKSGETFTLSCATNLPWFLCIWEGPGGLACQCQTQEGGVSAMCLGDQRVMLSGGSTTCEMTISGVLAEDAGRYRCVLADREDIVTVARSIDVNVGVAALVSWVDIGSSVSVEAESETEFACLAEGGFPEPTIEIIGPDNLRLGRQESSISQTAPGIDVTQTITYVGRDEDNDNLLICTAAQTGIDGAELYTSSVDARLAISPAPVGSALAIPIGGIIGIILGLLLLLALCAFCIFFFFCWDREKKKPKRQVEDNTSESSESEYETERVVSKSELKEVQVVSESSQQQGYVGGFANLQGNNDAQTVHIRSEEEESLLKTSNEDLKVIGAVKGKTKKKKNEKLKVDKGYFPGKYEEEYNQQRKIAETEELNKMERITNVNTIKNRNTSKTNVKKVTNHTQLQRITEEGDLYETYKGGENGYEGGLSSEDSGRFIFAEQNHLNQHKTELETQKNVQNDNNNIVHIQNDNSNIVLKIIHDNCDNKIEEFHQTNIKTKNETNLDGLLLVGNGHNSTNGSTNTQYNKKTQTKQNLSQTQQSLASKETQTARLQRRSSSSNSDFSNKSVHIEKNNVLPAFKIQNEIKIIQEPGTGFKKNIEESHTNNTNNSTTVTTNDLSTMSKNKLTATNSTESSTSASSLSEYEANYEPPRKVPDNTENRKITQSYEPPRRFPDNIEMQKTTESNSKPKDPTTPTFIDKYTLNQYKLNDCDTINTKGMTYTQIIEEHLSRNPSVETSKSSIELRRHKENGTSDDSSAAFSPSPSFRAPSEYKEHIGQTMDQDNSKEKKSKYNKITEKYVQNAVQVDAPHVIDDKTVVNSVNNVGTVSSANHGEIIEQHLHQQPGPDSNKDTVGKSSMMNTKSQQQINHENYQPNAFESGSLITSSLYVASAKSKENHREVIESHLRNNHESMKTSITQPAKQEQVKSYQENYQEFASGVVNGHKPSSVLSFDSSVEAETTKSTATVDDHFIVIDKEIGNRKDKSGAKTSTPRESMGDQQTDNNDVRYKHIKDYLTNKDYFQMLREKNEYLSTEVDDKQTHAETTTVRNETNTQETGNRVSTKQTHRDTTVRNDTNIREMENRVSTKQTNRDTTVRNNINIQETGNRMSSKQTNRDTTTVRNDTNSRETRNKVSTEQTKTKTKHVKTENVTQRKTKHDVMKNASTDDFEGRTKKYIITQQEIVFYLKNADGVLRIIHRPLMSRKEEYTEDEESRNVDKSLRVRRLSQPNLHTNQTLRQMEGSNHIEIKPEESKRVKHLKNEEKHIANVGVIYQSSPVNEGNFDPMGGNWRSSGSIFDCEQGCFSDHTVII